MKKIILVLAGLVVLGCIGIGGYWLGLKEKDSNNQSAVAQTKQTTTETTKSHNVQEDPQQATGVTALPL